jgi:transposase-like protein
MAAIVTKWPAERRASLEAALRESYTVREAAQRMGVTEPTLRGAFRAYRDMDYRAMLKTAPVLGAASSPEEATENELLRRKVSGLISDLKEARERALTDEIVKREIIGLKATRPDIPDWTLRPPRKSKSPGAPSLFISDIHNDEIVDPSQIEGANEYDPDIMERRLRTLTEGTIELLTEHVVRPEYPGIVLVNGGDDMGGEIHAELARTNASDPGPAFLRLLGIRIWMVERFASQFGRVFFVGVPGNHGRMDDRPTAKGYAHRNWDWLEYQMLRLHFQGDDRVSFLIPDGSDALFRIYGHRYLLTHGNQFRGGDGIIGPLGPITRGDNKKRARNVLLGSEYDTLLLAHFHRYMQLRSIIVNGSVKGYDEYAYQGNFSFEPPIQALWLTHPDRGITISMPVFLEPKQASGSREWIEWAKGRAAA